jgi:hypothetical protein
MKLTKIQLKQMIREEIQKLAEQAKKGDFVSFVHTYKGQQNKWYLTYIDSTHVYLSLDEPTGGRISGMSTYHIQQLNDKSYYDDMVKWMDSGNKKHINGKTYRD